jgi:hypothetical protein
LASSVPTYPIEDAVRAARTLAERERTMSCAAFDKAFVLVPVSSSSAQFAARFTRSPAPQIT